MTECEDQTSLLVNVSISKTTYDKNPCQKIYRQWSAPVLHSVNFVGCSVTFYQKNDLYIWMLFYVAHYIGKLKQKKFSENKKNEKLYLGVHERIERKMCLYDSLTGLELPVWICGHLIFSFHNINVLSLLWRQLSKHLPPDRRSLVRG